MTYVYVNFIPSNKCSTFPLPILRREFILIQWSGALTLSSLHLGMRAQGRSIQFQQMSSDVIRDINSNTALDADLSPATKKHSVYVQGARHVLNLTLLTT